MRNVEEFGASSDAVVVGGGVIGLACARELARRGLSVTLIERGAVGAEASWAAGGILAPQVESDARDAFFDFACASRDAYPDFAAELLEETGVDVEFDQTGTLYLALGDGDATECERRFDWQRRAHLAVERLTLAEARALEPRISPRALLALRFPRDWQVENRRLVEALALAAVRAGARIYERTQALALHTGRGGSRVRAVETSRGTIETGAVVVACGAWSSLLPVRGAAADAIKSAGNSTAVPHVEPVRGQMLCFETPAGGGPFARHVIYSPRGYLVPRRDGRLLAGSTTERAGFDKSVTAEGRAAITAHAVEIAPAVAGLRLADAWAGLRPRSEDDWPVVGASAEIENLFYATGHYRNGILLAPLTGRLVAEMVAAGVAPPPLAPFSPARFQRATSGVAL